jgi:hypothetical protein
VQSHTVDLPVCHLQLLYNSSLTNPLDKPEQSSSGGVLFVCLGVIHRPALFIFMIGVANGFGWNRDALLRIVRASVTVGYHIDTQKVTSYVLNRCLRVQRCYCGVVSFFGLCGRKRHSRRLMCALSKPKQEVSSGFNPISKSPLKAVELNYKTSCHS